MASRPLPEAACPTADGYVLAGGIGQHENIWRMADVRGPEGDRCVAGRTTRLMRRPPVIRRAARFHGRESAAATAHFGGPPDGVVGTRRAFRSQTPDHPSARPDTSARQGRQRPGMSAGARRSCVTGSSRPRRQGLGSRQRCANLLWAAISSICRRRISRTPLLWVEKGRRRWLSI